MSFAEQYHALISRSVVPEFVCEVFCAGTFLSTDL